MILTTMLLLCWCRRGTLRRRCRYTEALERMALQTFAIVALHSNGIAHRLITVTVMTRGILSASTVRLPACAIG